MSSIIYVLHERESRSHFLALETYAKKADRIIKFREFSISRGIIKGLITFNIKLLFKQILNLTFLFSILFSMNKTIILGIAPYDWRLYFLRWALKGHKVFYFTSWVDWSGDFFPKKKLGNHYQLRKVWKQFLENEIFGIFSVTKTGLLNLQKHYSIKCSCSVVNHAFNDSNITNNAELVGSEKLRLIYVGRLIKNKGIAEMLDLILTLDSKLVELTIVGDGDLVDLVTTYSKQYSNITYLGFINSQIKLFDAYKQHDVQLLFSRKTELWEELFGMVIVEAMANGVVTISTNHAGPLEIIENGVNGFIIPDDENIVTSAKDIVLHEMVNLQTMKKNAIRESEKYKSNQVALKWKKLLDE